MAIWLPTKFVWNTIKRLLILPWLVLLLPLDLVGLMMVEIIIPLALNLLLVVMVAQVMVVDLVAP